MRQQLFKVTLALSALLLVGQGCLSVGGDGAANTNGPAGMFISADRAETWTTQSVWPRPDGLQSLAGISVYRLFDDPGDPSAMYWASRAQGLFYTYDGGNSWERPTSGPISGFIYGVAVHPADKCTIYATNGSQVFRSNDCNRTWSEVYRVTSGDRVNSIAMQQFPPYRIYMVTGNGDFLRSEDQGVSWRVLRRFRTRMIDVFADPHVEDRVFVGSQKKGLWRSVDGGENWVNIDNPFLSISGGHEYRRFYIHPEVPDLLFYASTYGIHRSADGAEHWDELSLITPPGSARIFGLAANPQNPNEIYYTATINNRSTLYKSVDGGQTWITRKLPSGQIPTVLRNHPTDPDILHVGFTVPPS